jgi:glutaredoxin
MNNVVLYTKENCYFCTLAKSVLVEQNISFKEMKLGEDYTLEYIKERFSSAKTFPVIVVDGFYIGGATELKMMIETTNATKNNQKFLQEGAR